MRERAVRGMLAGLLLAVAMMAASSPPAFASDDPLPLEGNARVGLGPAASSGGGDMPTIAEEGGGPATEGSDDALETCEPPSDGVEALDGVGEPAAEPVAEVGDAEVVRVDEEDVDGMSGQERMDAYVAQYLDSQIDDGRSARRLFAMSGGTRPWDAGGRLTGPLRNVYEALRKMVAEVAAGTRSSTIFEVPFSEIVPNYDGPWDSEALGVDEIMSDGAITEAAKNATYEKIGCTVDKEIGIAFIDFRLVMNALKADCPYEMYWYGLSYAYSTRPFSYAVYEDNGKTLLGFNESSTARFYIYVSSDYLADGATSTTEVGPVMAPVNDAVENAKEIAERHASKAPYARLEAYKDEICDLVDYSMETYWNADTTPYGNPWQLVHVFDGDPSTQVVCEGYAKAFKYLCDLSNSTDVGCITATGTMGIQLDGSDGMNHMWNIVRMDDGRSYLVDVTNCDTDTIGYPNMLFLVPKSSGSYESSYAISCDGSSAVYEYSETTKDLYDKDMLVLAATPYVNPKAKSISSAKVTISGSYVYDLSVKDPDVRVELDGETLVRDADYEVTCSPHRPVNAGSVKVSIRGIGNYKDATRASFTIAKADPHLTVSPAKYVRVYGDLPFVIEGISKGAFSGNLEYSSSDEQVAGVDAMGCVTPKSSGNAIVTITAKENKNYASASTKVVVWVKKAANTLFARARKARVAVTQSEKGATATGSNVVVRYARGSVAYTNASKDATAKGFSVDGGTGEVTVPEATRPGTYVVKVRVTAAGDDNHKPGGKTVAYEVAIRRAGPTGIAKASRPRTVARTSGGEVAVSWEAAKGAKAYQLQWRRAGAKRWTTVSVKGRKKTLTGLERGALYELRVRGVSGEARGKWSAATARWLRGVSKAKAAPGKAKGSVRATWAADRAATGGFRVFVYAGRGGKLVKTEAVRAGATSATVRGLRSGRAYCVRVRPYRAEGGATYCGALSGWRAARAR